MSVEGWADGRFLEMLFREVCILCDRHQGFSTVLRLFKKQNQSVIP